MRRLVAISLVIAALSILAVVAALFIVNVLVLPGVLRRTESTLRRSGMSVEIARGRLLPLRGAIIEELTISTRRVEITIDSARFPVTLRSALALRSGIPDAPPISILDPVGTLVTWSEWLATSNVAPESLELEGITIGTGISGDLEIDLATVEKNRERRTYELAARTASTEGGLDARFSIGYAAPELSGAIRASLSDLTRLPAGAGMFEGEASLEIELHSVDQTEVDAIVSIAASDLSLSSPTLASEPVGPIDLTFEAAMRISPSAVADRSFEPEFLENATIRYPPPILMRRRSSRSGGKDVSDAPRTGRVVVERGEIEINGVEARLRGSLEGIVSGSDVEGWNADLGALELSILLPSTPVARLLSAVPESVSGAISRMDIDGVLKCELLLQLPFDEPDESIWSARSELERFAVLEIPREINVFALNEAFSHRIDGASNASRRSVQIPAALPASDEWMLRHSEHPLAWIEAKREEEESISSTRQTVVVLPVRSEEPHRLDPDYRYVRLEEMSRWIVATVLTAEDGDFFFYDGINPVTFTDAVIRNIAEGEVVVGGSTITMQLIKMLFLGHDRIFARKLQEAWLVYLAEQVVPVPKDRILELYLNLAEFGPDIYGIDHAATYYFDKSPAELDAGEAAWLATILPAPRSYHDYFISGEIPDEWFGRMISLFGIMLERGRMSGAEHNAAVGRRPVFRGNDM